MVVNDDELIILLVVEYTYPSDFFLRQLGW